MKNFECGQTLVTVLLVVAVSLLVGMGAATRSTRLVQQSTFDEESTQALHFAEGCAEVALGIIKEDPSLVGLGEKICCDIDGGGVCDVKDASHDCSADDYDCHYVTDELEWLFPGLVEQDDVGEMKLEGGTCSELNVYWCAESEGDTCSTPDALEVIEVFESGGVWSIGKEVLGRRTTFTSPSGGGGDPGNGVDYSFNHNLLGEDEFAVNPDRGSKVLRFIPRFRDFHIYVETNCSDLPRQGYSVSAEGWFGRSRRKVRVTKTEPAMPAIFDYAVFSGSETQPLEKR